MSDRIKMMVKSVLFDLDGTLLDRDKSIEQFIAAQYDRLGNRLRHIPKIDYITKFIELDCRGHVWKDEVYQALVTEFDIKGISWQLLLHDYETQFQFHCVPFPFLDETLVKLQQQGYLLGIVTNGRGQFQNLVIDGLGIRKYFEAILISELEGVRKPQSEIFHRAINRLGGSTSDSVFVGDNPEADILGAKSVGMQTIWKRNLHWLEPQAADVIIDELNEVPLIIEQFTSNL
jgi:putative hydrolase of the HAD superfamily